jgi:hypothetical protein
MGTLSERWKGIVDLRLSLRLPIAVLVGALLCYGFFPQSLVQMVTPVLRTYLTTDRHLTEQYRPSALMQRDGYKIQEIVLR